MEFLSRAGSHFYRWLEVWMQVLMAELIAATKPSTDFRR